MRVGNCEAIEVFCCRTGFSWRSFHNILSSNHFGTRRGGSTYCGLLPLSIACRFVPSDLSLDGHNRLRFLSTSRERLRELAQKLGVHHLANLDGCSA